MQKLMFLGTAAVLGFGGLLVASCLGAGDDCRVYYDCTGKGKGLSTCKDEIQNGGESDIDCGGPCGPICEAERRCEEDTDCAGNECASGRCIANCADGMLNNGETAVDCGGPNCPPCELGKPCLDANGVVVNHCASKHCVDGVCCDIACSGECQACVADKTGGQTGTCAPVRASTDPDDECAPEPGTCGNSDGMCSGKAACNKHGTDTPCGPGPSCNDDGALSNQDYCDGEGKCADKGVTSCGPYACRNGSCLSVCSGPTDCALDYDCSNGNCKKMNGIHCIGAEECTSGSCVDGVCCNYSCDEKCLRCDLDGKKGECHFIPWGQDPDNECVSVLSCNGGGKCQGLAGRL